MNSKLTQTQVFELVKKNILEILPKTQADLIVPDQSLADLGANSVDRMEIVTLSMEDLGVKIPLMSFARVFNIESLVEVLFTNQK
jgi:polyketide biosynthesis acyl carrier protein